MGVMGTQVPAGLYRPESVALAGRCLAISVQDTGIGIPSEALSSIFDRFVQARNRREGKTQGTGLGLAFCRKVMDAHGGYIWAESTLGEGSLFTALFPLPASDQPAGGN
jgi:signal transduction histidine kinase